MTPRTLAAAALCLAVGAGVGFAGGRLSANSSTTDDLARQYKTIAMVGVVLTNLMFELPAVNVSTTDRSS